MGNITGFLRWHLSRYETEKLQQSMSLSVWKNIESTYIKNINVSKDIEQNFWITAKHIKST